MARNDNWVEKESATWPVRKNLGIFNLLVTEHNAEKKTTTKKCVTAGKFHCKLEWIFVEEDRREGVQFVLGIAFLD